MIKRTDHEELLADVLAGESQAGFSDALLGETLRHARRRRQWRQVRRASVATLLLLVAGLGVWRSVPRGKQSIETSQPPAPPRPYQLIVSRPLTDTQVVTTQPLATEALLVAESTVPTIRTYDGGFREVGDDELLKLAEPQIAALIRRGPHEAELILVAATEETATHGN